MNMKRRKSIHERPSWSILFISQVFSMIAILLITTNAEDIPPSPSMLPARSPGVDVLALTATLKPTVITNATTFKPTATLRPSPSSVRPTVTNIPTIADFVPTRRPTAGAPNLPTVQYDTLHEFYDATNGPHWAYGSDGLRDNTYPWNFSDPKANPCADKWAGITCNKCTAQAYIGPCYVIALDLIHFKLEGTIPTSIANISTLTRINFAANFLHGTIPTTIQKLTNLIRLQLNENLLSGTLPDIWHAFTNLTRLDVSQTRVGGTLPPSFYNLTTVFEVDVTRCKFVGTISNAIGNLKKLQLMYFATNNFTGTIPVSLAEFPSIQRLRLENNSFTGTIPPALGNLHSLTLLALDFNRLTGTIPGNIGQIPELQDFTASFNFLHGSIPTHFFTQSTLNRLDFTNNLLTSNLPIVTLNVGLPEIRFFAVHANHLTGTLPDISQSNSLNFFMVGINQFTGTVTPNIYSPTLFSLDIGWNYLSGPLPIANSKFVGFYEANGNVMSGTIPKITNALHLPAIVVIEILNNTDVFKYLDPAKKQAFLAQLEAVSSEKSLNSILYVLNTTDNNLVGTIPNWITNSSLLTYSYLGNNHLTGSVPEIYTQPSVLAVLNFGYNTLQGTIPESYANIPSLSELQLNNNQLHGTLSTWLFTSSVTLQNIFLQSNRFTGSIPDISDIAHSALTLVELSDNAFTGTIPASFFELKNLTLFSVSENCLTGGIPDAVCNSITLQSLILDGISTAKKCRQPIFSLIPALTSFTLQNNIDGSIPSCLFAMPNLRTLHMSGNGFLGSLSSNLQLGCALTDLGLSHNGLAGSIPSVIQHRVWERLDLSYNKFGGTLSSTAFEYGVGYCMDSSELSSANSTATDDSIASEQDEVEDMSIYLDVNRLSGSIPSALLPLYDISILYGNLFACNAQKDTKDLPAHDPKTSSYVCGSNSVNQAMFIWVAIFGTAVLLFLLARYTKPRWVQLYILPRLLKLRVWYECITVQERGQVTIKGQVLYLQEDNPIYLWHVFMQKLRQYSGYLTLFLLLVMMPLYASLSLYEGSYVDSYAWSLSAAYLSGVPSGLALMVGFMLTLTIVYFLFDKRMRVMIDKYKQSSHRNIQPARRVTTLLPTSSDVSNKMMPTVSEPNANPLQATSDAGDVKDAADRPVTKEEEESPVTSGAVNAGQSQEVELVSIAPSTVATSGTSIASTASISSPTSSFSQQDSSSSSSSQGSTVDTASPSTLTSSTAKQSRSPYFRSEAVIFMSKHFQVLFLVGLCNMCLMTTLNVGYVSALWYLEDKDAVGFIRVMLSICKLLWNDYGLWRLMWNVKIFIYSYGVVNTTQAKHYVRFMSKKEIFLMAWSILFNNIIAPSLSVAIVSPTCFYNAFVASESVQSSYTYCAVLVRIGRQGNVCQSSAIGTSTYNPPFIYNYNCASLVPVNYVQVYAYMMMISAFVNPLIRFGLKALYDYVLVRDTWLYLFLESYLSPLLRKFQAERIPPPGSLLYNYAENRLFNKNRFIIRIVSYITLLVSFGVVFPPLGVVIWISMMIFTIIETLVFGRVLHETKQLGYDWYAKQLRFETQGIMELLIPTILPITFVASLVYATLVFDTLGDGSSYRLAIAPSLLLIMYPLLMWLAFRAPIYKWTAYVKQLLGCSEEGGSEEGGQEEDFGDYEEYEEGIKAMVLLQEAIQGGERTKEAGIELQSVNLTSIVASEQLHAVADDDAEEKEEVQHVDNPIHTA